MIKWKKNQKFKDLNSLLKILVYLFKNIVVLFEVQKKKKNWEKIGRIMLLSKCAVCDRKRLIKEQKLVNFYVV